MKVPVSWLREYVPIEMPISELADRLVLSTCEVELSLVLPSDTRNQTTSGRSTRSAVAIGCGDPPTVQMRKAR